MPTVPERLAGSFGRACDLDLRVVNLGPKLGVEITYKKTIFKNTHIIPEERPEGSGNL